eukprot:scaffold311356_cov22-Tisochrysis_lutea.AAC.2
MPLGQQFSSAASPHLASVCIQAWFVAHVLAKSKRFDDRAAMDLVRLHKPERKQYTLNGGTKRTADSHLLSFVLVLSEHLLNEAKLGVKTAFKRAQTISAKIGGVPSVHIITDKKTAAFIES